MWEIDRANCRLLLDGIQKGNCLDNACAEGFFGHLKDEFYRGREWPTFEGFRRDLEAYLTHWNLDMAAQI